MYEYPLGTASPQDFYSFNFFDKSHCHLHVYNICMRYRRICIKLHNSAMPTTNEKLQWFFLSDISLQQVSLDCGVLKALYNLQTTSIKNYLDVSQKNPILSRGPMCNSATHSHVRECLSLLQVRVRFYVRDQTLMDLLTMFG